MFRDLREVLTIERVSGDLRRALEKSHWQVELDGKQTSVDPDVVFHVVARGCHTYEYAMGFGDHFRVLVAIGGVREVKHGIVYAELCFATMYYNPEFAMFTLDISRDMP